MNQLKVSYLNSKKDYEQFLGRVAIGSVESLFEKGNLGVILEAQSLRTSGSLTRQSAGLPKSQSRSERLK